jgi:hypothetical protein
MTIVGRGDGITALKRAYQPRSIDGTSPAAVAYL